MQNSLSKKIFHFIPNLNFGGAEIQLNKILEADIKNGIFPNLVLFTVETSVLLKKLENQKINIFVFDFKSCSFLSKVRNFLSLIRLIREAPKDSTFVFWMYHCFFLSIFLRLFNPGHFVWMVRRSSIPSGLTRFFCWISSIFSSFIPNRIICNSLSGLRIHIDYGFSSKNITYIPNVIDFNYTVTSVVDFNKVIKLDNRESCKVFGYVARFNKVKGHDLLIESLNHLECNNFNYKCVLIGRDLESFVSTNVTAQKLLLSNKLIILPENNSPSTLVQHFDFFVSPSHSEGFSNVIAEAMVLAKSCIATDVGDNKEIIGQTGILVAANSAVELAEALCVYLSSSQEFVVGKGLEAFNRVSDLYKSDVVFKKLNKEFLLGDDLG